MASLLLLAVAGCSDDAGTAPPGQDGGGETGNDTGDVTADVPDDEGGGDTTPDAVDDGDVTPGDTPGDTVFDGGGDFFTCVPSGAEECNGFDDNCDGRVDEACGCPATGQTQSCYLGAPSDLEAENARCEAGVQECLLEFWADCEGAVGPVQEICGNNIDDDCDGVVDCEVDPVEAICPPDFQDRVLNTYTLTGDWSTPEGVDVVSYAWAQTAAPPGHSRDISFDGTDITFFADVAGEYVFEFTIDASNGASDSCETRFLATTADVLRVEMFWNPNYEEGEGVPRDRSDIDLHLFRDPAQLSDPGDHYYRDPSGQGVCNDPGINDDNCHWINCATCSDVTACPEGQPVQYYSLGDTCDTAFQEHDCQRFGDRDRVRECLCRDFISNPPEGTDAADIWPPPVLEWGDGGSDEDDPRLDLDDREGKGPENINIRRPEPGTYRVAVHYFDAQGFGTPDVDGCRPIEVRLRIFCGSEQYDTGIVELRGRGGTESLIYWWENDFWEVGDLTISYNGETPQCSFDEFLDEGVRPICKAKWSDDGCDPASEPSSCETDPGDSPTGCAALN